MVRAPTTGSNCSPTRCADLEAPVSARSTFFAMSIGMAAPATLRCHVGTSVAVRSGDGVKGRVSKIRTFRNGARRLRAIPRAEVAEHLRLPVYVRKDLGAVDDRRKVDSGWKFEDRRVATRDRRVAPRTKTFLGTQIVWPDGKSTHCIVRNRSATGAKIKVSSEVPQAFTLIFIATSRYIHVK